MCWSRSNRDSTVPISPAVPVGTSRHDSYERSSNPVYHDGEAIAAFAEGRYRSPSSMADLQSPIVSPKARKQHVPYETPEKLPRRPLSQVFFDDHTAGQRSDKIELGRRVYSNNPAFMSTVVLGPHDEYEVEKQPARSNSCGGYPQAMAAGGYTRFRQDDRYLCEKASRKVFHQGLGTRARQLSDYDDLSDVYDKCADHEHNKPAGISNRLRNERSERKKGTAADRHGFRGLEAAGNPSADAEEKARKKKHMPQRPCVEDVAQVVYNKSINLHDVHHFEQVRHALHSGAAGAGVDSFDF